MASLETPPQFRVFSTSHRLVLSGSPVPWQAARALPSGGRVPPKRQLKYADQVRAQARQQLPDLWLEKGVAVELSCRFSICRPKSHYGSGRNAKTLKPQFSSARPTGRPDLSNLVKMVEDALTGEVWADDDQVVAIAARKGYIHWWEPERTVVELTVPGGAPS